MLTGHSLTSNVYTMGFSAASHRTRPKQTKITTKLKSQNTKIIVNARLVVYEERKIGKRRRNVLLTKLSNETNTT